MVIQKGYMNTRTVTLIVRYKAADGTWKRGTAVRGANGRIRPGYLRDANPRILRPRLSVAGSIVDQMHELDPFPAL
jgi:hypothetical protein